MGFEKVAQDIKCVRIGSVWLGKVGDGKIRLDFKGKVKSNEFLISLR